MTPAEAAGGDTEASGQSRCCGALSCFFKANSECRFDQISGVLLGAQSITFLKHRQRILESVRTALIADGFMDEKESDKNNRIAPNLHMSSGEHMKELEGHANFFYAWECFTLSRAKSTVDFVIKDRANLLALLHVAHHYTQSERHKLTVE